jgi:hypothetical protein
MSQGLPFERGTRARRARSTSGELTRKQFAQECRYAYACSNSGH